MSAIGAILNRDGMPVAREDIERLARAMAPYGRDLQRTSRHDEVALACALGIYTAEDVGKPQPVSGGDGRFTMLFDGRIDNRDDLAAKLGLGASELAAMSDAQLAMRGFEKWGERCLLEWVADFALILWDAGERKLLLARDPFGRHGLVYYHEDRRFVAATLPGVLHALPEVPYAIDEVRVADSFAQLMTEGQRTFFAGILSVLPGHVLTVDRAGITERQYYRLRDHVKPVRLGKDGDYVEAARELFETAVNARLRCRGRIGAFMSGGLDSTTAAVTAAAALRAKGQRLPTFTWVPQADWDGRTEAHAYGDESPYVRAVGAAFPDIDLNLIPATGINHYHRQDEYLRLSGLPMRNAVAIGYLHALMESARAQGVTVMLGGEWGNMTLSHTGMGAFAELWRSGRLHRLTRELWRRERGMKGLARSFFALVLPTLLTDEGWDRMQAWRGKATLAQRFARFTVVRGDYGAAAGLEDRARDSGFDYWGRPRVGGAEFRIWSIERMLGNFGQWQPAVRAMHGIDLRDPFSDRRLVEWCLGVPETQYYRDGQPRWLIRRMMRGILPDPVLDKPRDIGRANADWQVRLKNDVPRMQVDLKGMRQDPDLARMVDFDRIESWLDGWPDSSLVDADDDRRMNLSLLLPMTIQTARFVQIVKGSNA